MEGGEQPDCRERDPESARKMDEGMEPREKPIEIEAQGDDMHRTHDRDEDGLKYEKSAHEAGTKKPACAGSFAAAGTASLGIGDQVGARSAMTTAIGDIRLPFLEPSRFKYRPLLAL